MRDPLAPLPPRRHPYQVWLVAACAFTGLTLAVGGPRPGSLNELLPTVLVGLWAWTLLGAGTLALAAALWRDDVTGMLLERVALLPLAAMMLVYAGAVVLVVPGGLAGAIIIGSVGAASVWRAVQVHRVLRALRSGRTPPPELAAPELADPP